MSWVCIIKLGLGIIKKKKEIEKKILLNVVIVFFLICVYVIIGDIWKLIWLGVIFVLDCYWGKGWFYWEGK